MNGAGVGRWRKVADRPFAAGEPQPGLREALVRALEEAVEHAELVEDLHGRGVDGVAAEIAQEVACFSSTRTFAPARANSRPAIIPAGPPPAIEKIGFLRCHRLTIAPEAA